MLGLDNDCEGMWMEHVTLWVQLQRKDPFKMVKGQGQSQLFARIWRKLGEEARIVQGKELGLQVG